MRPFKPVFWPVPIIAKKGTPSWVIEQKKYESRYWTLRGFGLWYLFCRLFYPAGLCRVECASRAQEIRARNKRTHEDWRTLARQYASTIYNARNYDFFAAAGWGEERVYNEILSRL